MAWDPPLRPAELAETRIIAAILDGQFPINSTLPPERDLSTQLGVTRPTLREALQRLARDGWLEIRHGRPTRVRDYWHEGSLGVLGAIARSPGPLPPPPAPRPPCPGPGLHPARRRTIPPGDRRPARSLSGDRRYARGVRRGRLAPPSRPDHRFWQPCVHTDSQRLRRPLPQPGRPVFRLVGGPGSLAQLLRRPSSLPTIVGPGRRRGAHAAGDAREHRHLAPGRSLGAGDREAMRLSVTQASCCGLRGATGRSDRALPGDR